MQKQRGLSAEHAMTADEHFRHGMQLSSTSRSPAYLSPYSIFRRGQAIIANVALAATKASARRSAAARVSDNEITNEFALVTAGAELLVTESPLAVLFGRVRMSERALTASDDFDYVIVISM